MKKFLILFVCTFSLSLLAEAQSAKKPRLVVIPSDNLLLKYGCLKETDNMGETAYQRCYEKALQNDDIRACIVKLGEVFKDSYNFPLTSLDNELQRINAKGVGVVPVDIRLELNYKINKMGPRNVLYFELVGIDQYSSKQIASTSGESKPSIGGSLNNMLQEAALAQLDKFANDIQSYFDEMMVKGRESRLTIVSDVAQLDKVIIKMTEEWLSANCVNGSFSTDNVEPNEINISQAMMPVFNQSGKALAASDFYTGLVNYLTSKVQSKNFEAAFNRRAEESGSRGGTLGDAIIVIQEASGDEF